VEKMMSKVGIEHAYSIKPNVASGKEQEGGGRDRKKKLKVLKLKALVSLMVWSPGLYMVVRNFGFNLENLEKKKKTRGRRNTNRHTEKQAKEGYGKMVVIYQGNFYRGML
jgi:hypothetical protein